MPIGPAAGIARGRLLRRIDEATGLVVVWGPSGAGKSVLVSHWIEVAGIDCALWFDPPEAGTEPAEYWSSIEVRIAASETSPSAVVLDLPDLVADPRTGDRLRALARMLPEAKVIVILRDANSIWHRELGRSAATIVQPAELRFDEHEAAELFSSAGVRLSKRTFRALVSDSVTAGHAALVDGTLPIARLFVDEFELESRWVRDASDQLTRLYVEQELFGRDSVRALRDLVLALGCARVVNEVVAACLGGPNAVAALPLLEREGLLVRRPGPGSHGFHFVPPVQRMLAKMARSEDAGTVSRDLSRLARHLLQSGDSDEALWHATEAEDWPLVIEILASSWFEIAATRFTLLDLTMRRLPSSFAASSPALQSAHSMFQLLGPHPGSGAVPLVSSSVELEAISREHTTADALLVGTFRSVAVRLRGEFADALALDSKLDALAARWVAEQAHTTESGLEANLPFLQLQWGVNSLLHGDHVRAAELFRIAYRGSGTGFSELVAQNAAGGLALHYAMLGEPNLAQSWIRTEESFDCALGWLGSMVRAPALIARALVAIARLDLDAATEALQELGDTVDGLELWAFAEYARSMLDVYRGEPEIGLDRLRRIRINFARWATPSSFAAPLLKSAVLELQSAASRPADAHERELLEDSGLHPVVRVARARAALLAGEPKEALADCAILAKKYGGYTRVRLDALVVETLSLVETGELARAVATWNRAMTLAEDTGCIRPLAMLDADTLDVLIPLGGRPLESGHPALAHGQRPVFKRKAMWVELSAREESVLGHLHSAHTISEIAQIHFVSPNTVKSQLRTLYRKLGASNRQEAIEQARRRGLI